MCREASAYTPSPASEFGFGWVSQARLSREIVSRDKRPRLILLAKMPENQIAYIGSTARLDASLCRSLALHYWSVRLARTSTGTSASSAARMLLRLLRVWPADARVPCRSGYPVQDLSASLSPPCRQQRRRLFRLRLGVARRQGRQHAARAGAPMVRATFPLLRVASGSGFESDVWLGLAGRRRRRTMRRQPGSKARLCDGTVLPCL